MLSESVPDRLRELLSAECMVPSCSGDPDPILVGGSVLLLCPEHRVDVAVELAKRERDCSNGGGQA